MSTITPQEAEKIVKESLRVGYEALRKEGEAAKNIEGDQRDITTRGDIIVGDAIIENIKSYKIPFTFYTEEKGKIRTAGAENSAILDDIDGTDNFKRGLGMLPYGSILGIFDNEDPIFSNCISAGFLEFNRDNLFYATKGKGAHLIKNFSNLFQKENKTWIKTSGRETIKGEIPSRFMIDLYMLGNLAPSFARYSGEDQLQGDFRCKALHMVQVAYGGTDLFVFADNCNNLKKRATAEELAPGYLIVKEAGGSVLDWSDKDIGNQKVGMGEKKGYNIIVAATENLGRDLLKDLQRDAIVSKYISDKYRI